MSSLSGTTKASTKKKKPSPKRSSVVRSRKVKLINTSSTDLELVVKEGTGFGNYCLLPRGSMEILFSGITNQIKELERRHLLCVEMTK
tara:strand:+ start:501 stop:764 length:264 start_codon:yes stop_codon:yes gene_type:complete